MSNETGRMPAAHTQAADRPSTPPSHRDDPNPVGTAGRQLRSVVGRVRQATAGGALEWLGPVLRPERGRTALAIATVLTGTGLGLLLPYVVKIAIDDGITARDTRVLQLAVVAYAGLALLQALAGRAEILLVTGVGERTLRRIRTLLFGHLQRLSLDFYERERTGRIVARMTSDVEAMGNLVTSGLVNMVSAVVTLAGVTVVLVALEWRLAVTTLVVLPVGVMAARWFRARSRPAWRAVRERTAVVTVRLQEALTGVRTIRAFGQEERTLQGVADANDAERRAHRRTIRYASLFFPGVEFLGTAAAAAVLVVGGWLVTEGTMQVGTLVAFLLYLRSLFAPVQQLSELYAQVQAAAAGAERVGSVLRTEPSVREAPGAVTLPRPRGELTLETVWFAYGGTDGNRAEDRTVQPALRGMDLQVPAGTTLALVGPTGAGKSTVAKLLTRFYDPTGGRVTLDGVDLRQLRLDSLRTAVGYIPQEGFLFAGTVAENIRYGRPEATDAEVEAAARAVGADLLLHALVDGYTTEVGERGSLLSAGERQLVAFARAWLADPAVLVLDEATSSLDTRSEARIQEAMRRLRRGRTTVVIAHRLATVLDADTVAVVTDGKVVELGPPGRLAEAGGHFAELYARWTAGVT